jgi:hypothetical protein
MIKPGVNSLEGISNSKQGQPVGTGKCDKENPIGLRYLFAYSH